MISTINSPWGRLAIALLACLVGSSAASLSAGTESDSKSSDNSPHMLVGRRLFEKEAFGGNGRTCDTCHSRETGTVSPEDAQRRLARDPRDPLFVGDGSDDGAGNGLERMLTHATVLVTVPLADSVRLAADPNATTAVFRRGIPTTLNTTALDPVLMWDGRQPTLDAQARSAILGHAAATRMPTAKELERIAEFERSRSFFSSHTTWSFAVNGRACASSRAHGIRKTRSRVLRGRSAGQGQLKARNVCRVP